MNYLIFVEKYIKESISTQSQIGQNVLIQSKVIKQSIEILRETIGDIGIQIEQKDKKTSFLENMIGVTDDKVVEEMNKIDFNKISNKKNVKELCIG